MTMTRLRAPGGGVGSDGCAGGAGAGSCERRRSTGRSLGAARYIAVRAMGSLSRAGTRDASTIAQAGETRSARVESLRALAALAVLEGHVFGEHHNYDPAQTLDSFGHRLLFGGGLGVYIFFALTGYL